MMPPIPKAAVAKYWETFEDLIKDRCVRIDEGSGEGPLLHDEGFTAFIATKCPELLGHTMPPRIQLSRKKLDDGSYQFRVHANQRAAFHRHMCATTPHAKLAAVKSLAEETDDYIAGVKEKALGGAGQKFVWHVCVRVALAGNTRCFA